MKKVCTKIWKYEKRFYAKSPIYFQDFLYLTFGIWDGVDFLGKIPRVHLKKEEAD